MAASVLSHTEFFTRSVSITTDIFMSLLSTLTSIPERQKSTKSARKILSNTPVINNAVGDCYSLNLINNRYILY